MKKHLIWIIPVAVIIGVLAGLYGYFLSITGINERMKTFDTKDEQIVAFVEDFGEQLKEVSLLSPDASEQVKEQYGPYVADNLLFKWVEHPKEAPGRLTSSPWPARIAVESLQKVREGKYTVVAEIRFITSVQKATSESDHSSRKQIVLVVERQVGSEEVTSYLDAPLVDRWKITKYLVVPYESKSATSTSRFVGAHDKGNTSGDESEKTSLVKSCTHSGGTWREKYQECEWSGFTWCQNHGGSYQKCASACRHNPGAELCTMQCVQVCKL